MDLACLIGLTELLHSTFCNCALSRLHLFRVLVMHHAAVRVDFL
jgi:hypothetical protein